MPGRENLFGTTPASIRLSELIYAIPNKMVRASTLRKISTQLRYLNESIKYLVSMPDSNTRKLLSLLLRNFTLDNAKTTSNGNTEIKTFLENVIKTKFKSNELI